jgi:hypothetical protein
MAIDYASAKFECALLAFRRARLFLFRIRGATGDRADQEPKDETDARHSK